MPFSLTVPEAVARVRALDPTCNVFISTRLEEALADARARADEPRRTPLHGVPYALKDMWDTADLPTTSGSMRHRDRRPASDCPVREAFDAAGAVLVGKTNMSDLALPPEATSWIGGATRNPFEPTRTAGGSSGGSAAAVALGMAAFDWGTDFGGSIRLPAAFCGVLGMRLSASAWPVRGTYPETPAPVLFMNGQGPLARTTAEMRAVLRAARPRLATGPARPFSLRGAVMHPPDRGAWPTFAADAEPHLRAALGDVRASELPPNTHARNVAIGMYAAHFDDMLAVETLPFWQALRAALSAVILRGAFGDRRIHPATAWLCILMALGRVTLYRDKRRAVDAAARYRERIEQLWDEGFVVAMPVCAYPPPRIGTSIRNRHLLSCTMPGNVADATALAIPFGSFAGGLPRALQLMGPPGSEEALLDAADRLIASRDRDPALGLDARALDAAVLARRFGAVTAQAA
jgi:Asp-tRNA(Asn)/Glu-tRNA(Gln) amidotransferase A subunit family amidase